MEGLLTFSTHPGRYAIAQRGQPGIILANGDHIHVYIDGHWIVGQVEYGLVYHSGRGRDKGYYFIAEGNSQRLGLCLGMRVRTAQQ